MRGRRGLHAAIDLGASSARLFAGRLEGGKLTTSPRRRVPNNPVLLPDGLHWDLVGIYGEMLRSLAELSRQGDLVSVGVDGWGVDYGLLDGEGRLLGLPYHYRDARTCGLSETVRLALGEGGLYRATGVQEMEMNTVFQLLAGVSSPAYRDAKTLLMLPDLIGYFLTGERRFELTNASTTQLVDSRTGRLALGPMGRLGLRADIFPETIGPGDALGPVLTGVAASAGLAPGVEVVSVASHDTASAVLAVPAGAEHFAYVASGTWSLVGLELDAPVISEESRQANFSNELGVDGTVRFLRNTMGHWMLQVLEGAWAHAGQPRELSALLARAAGEPAFSWLVDTADAEFARPGDDMAERVRAACARNGGPVPQTDEALVRCIVDSMALASATTLLEAQRLADREVDVVHVVGGGSANRLYLDALAAATGLPVMAGPVEASAVGNLLMQLRAAGEAGDRKEMRAMVAASFPTVSVAPDQVLGKKAKLARLRLQGPGGG